MIRRLLVLASVLLCCAGCLPERSVLPPGGVPTRHADGEMRRLTEPEKAIIRSSVLSAVQYPDFAQFLWTMLRKQTGQSEFYCAQMNAQTASGQRVGFRPFVVLLDMNKDEVRQSKLVELAPSRLDMAAVVAKCRENGLDAFASVESDGVGTTTASRR